MKYILEIKPAILPKARHKIEDFLKKEGYDVSGGGTHTDLSCCDISFSRAVRKISPSFGKLNARH